MWLTRPESVKGAYNESVQLLQHQLVRKISLNCRMSSTNSFRGPMAQACSRCQHGMHFTPGCIPRRATVYIADEDGNKNGSGN